MANATRSARLELRNSLAENTMNSTLSNLKLRDYTMDTWVTFHRLSSGQVPGFLCVIRQD